MARLAGVVVALATTVRADDPPQVVAGRDFSLFLEPNENKVFGTGRNNFGQLGSPDGDSDSPIDIIFPVEPDENGTVVQPKVIAAAAGTFHSLFLTDEGCLWMTGRNHKKQIADGDGAAPFYTEPFLWREPDNGNVNCNVISIAAGYAHSLILAKVDGRPKLHSMGWNAYNQLGDLTDFELNFTAVAAGYDTSFGLTQDGRAFAWGNNLGGQLGIGLTGNTNSKPAEVQLQGGPEGAKVITEIVAGTSHTLFVSSVGGMWVTGANFVGQLGSTPSAPIHEPVYVLPGEDVTKVVAGGDSTCLIGGDHDDAYGAGSNLDGQLGFSSDDAPVLGDRFRMISRADVPSVDRWTMAALGDDHGLYLDTVGSAYATGSNKYGQLGLDLGNETSRPRLEEPPAIKLVPVTSTTVTVTATTLEVTTTSTTNESDTTPTREPQGEDQTDWVLYGWLGGLLVTACALGAGFWAQGQAAKYAADDDEQAAEVELARNIMSA